MANTNHDSGGWISGGSAEPHLTAAEALELERQVDASRDLLADATALQDRYSDAYLVGVALQRLRSLADAAEKAL
jgi:hypothetical protein